MSILLASTRVRGVAAARLVPHQAARQLSALPSADDLITNDWTTSVYQGSALTSSTLPNGVTCISTGAAVSKVVGVATSVGSACGPPGAALAAKLMAFKTTNGASDLLTQRTLELAGSTPYVVAEKTSTVTAVTATAEGAEAAVRAAALAAGVGREPVLDWEFEEAKAEPPALAALACEESALEDLVFEAAYGAGSPFAFQRSAEALAATTAADVDAYLAAAAAGPLTVVGVGLDHADLLAYATPVFAGLAPASPSTSPAPGAFAAGGLASKKGSSPKAAAALPAPGDAVLASVVAAALGADSSNKSGLLVKKVATAAEAKVAFKAAPLAAPVAKATAKTKFLSMTGLDLCVAVAGGFDPTTFAAAVDALPDAALDAEVKKAAAIDPAVALIVA